MQGNNRISASATIWGKKPQHEAFVENVEPKA